MIKFPELDNVLHCNLLSTVSKLACDSTDSGLAGCPLHILDVIDCKMKIKQSSHNIKTMPVSTPIKEHKTEPSLPRFGCSLVC